MNRILTTEQWQESLAEAFSKAVKSAYQDIIDEAVKAEREACAKVCDDLVRSHWNSTGDEDEPDAYDCAAAIRARGEKE